MNDDAIAKIADTILYEGYMLYPYRPSAIKNRQRWSFGTLYPAVYGEVVKGTESCSMKSECLLLSDSTSDIRITFRFLQFRSRRTCDYQNVSVPSISVEKTLSELWDEGTPRNIDFDFVLTDGFHCDTPFQFSALLDNVELRHSGEDTVGIECAEQQLLEGTLNIRASVIKAGVMKLGIEVENRSQIKLDPDSRDAALQQSFLSAHTILTARSADFVSLLDPPEHLQEEVGQLRNVGNFPVLVGGPNSRASMLCSPIVLYDYPQIAPESVGDFFDGTEMDEMLTLRVLTLTDNEKHEMRSSDSRADQLLRRTEDTAREQLMRTHGVIRSLKPVSEKL